MRWASVDDAPPADVRSLLDTLASSRARVAGHRVVAAPPDRRTVVALVEHHVFAVWDHASLLEVTRPHLAQLGLEAPPPVDVLAYADVMDEVGADTRPVRRFLALVAAGVEVRGALVMAEVPAGARRFVTNTWHTVATGSALERAAMFCFGRDDLVPDALRRSLAGVAPLARWLDRHLPADGGAGAEAAFALLATLCRHEDDWRLALATASEALAARTRLWDAVEASLAAAAGRPRAAVAGAERVARR
ncbi:MAG TPA: DUF3050 domain-containing protein [Acidimicrobiales bacterium]|jgi:hypothetical protein